MTNDAAVVRAGGFHPSVPISVENPLPFLVCFKHRSRVSALSPGAGDLATAGDQLRGGLLATHPSPPAPAAGKKPPATALANWRPPATWRPLLAT